MSLPNNSTGQATTEKKNTYRQGGAAKSLHGMVFQIKLLMLTFLKGGLRKTRQFRLATEMESAQQFDDVILEGIGASGETTYRFLQAKHTQDYSKYLSYSQLVLSQGGDFSLGKYFKSYRKIKSNEDFNDGTLEDYILWTNQGLNKEELERKGIILEVLPNDGDDIFNAENAGAKKPPVKYRLSVDKEHELYNVFRNTSNPADPVTDDEIEEFLEKFVLAVNQLNETELGDAIKKEIGNIGDGKYQLTGENIDDTFNRLYVTIEKWIAARGAGTYLSTKDARKFITSTITAEVKSTAMLVATAEGRLEKVKELLDEGADVEARNEMGSTALIIAVAKGNVNIVDHLLEKNASTSVADNNGRHPIIIATEKNNVDIVAALLRHGADAEVSDKRGSTSVHISTENGYTDTLRCLLDSGASSKAADFHGRSPVIIAIQNGDLNALQVLADSGADCCKVADKDGSRPIIIATQNEDLELVRFLVGIKVDVTAADATGTPALVVAGKKNNFDIVKLLVENGAAIGAADSAGLTALQFALRNKNAEMEDYLRGKGATW